MSFLVDSGVIYLVLGALLCVVIRAGAVTRMFREASRIEPPDPDRP
jgi:hypothetical protein